MSQLDSQTKDIAGQRFEVFKLPPLVAQDVLIDIGQVLAPALGRAASAVESVQGGNPLDMDLDDPRIGSAIAALVQGISKEKMRELIRIMADVTHCNGTPLAKTLEVTFRGDLALMYQWLWFALQVQFGSFTGWLGDAIGGLTLTAKAGRSPATSKDTGQP